MKVIIYGLGRRYYNLFDWREYVDLGMIINEIETVGLSDGNPDFWGERIVHNGRLFVVRNIREYSENEYDKIMVTSKECFEEIRDALIQQGCKSERIFLIDDIFEPYLELINNENDSFLNKHWMRFCETGNNAVSFFQAGRYRDVAIYGSGLLAEHFIHVCRQSDIQIPYLIESDEEGRFGDLPVYKIDAELPKVDIIVVATAENYMQIERELCKKNCTEIISLQEVIYKTLKNAKKE